MEFEIPNAGHWANFPSDTTYTYLGTEDSIKHDMLNFIPKLAEREWWVMAVENIAPQIADRSISLTELLRPIARYAQNSDPDQFRWIFNVMAMWLDKKTSESEGMFGETHLTRREAIYALHRSLMMTGLETLIDALSNTNPDLE
jgi:hypothetical protein